MAKKSSAGKWDVDFDGYEEKEGGYDGDEPKKGIYDARLVSLREHTSGEGNEGLEWQFDITEEPYVGWRGWVYSNMDSAKWKTQQIVKAISGGSEDGMRLDPVDGPDGSKSKTVKASQPVRLRIGREMYDDEPKARIRRVMVSENAKPAKKKAKKGSDDPF
jgi:hypothetical protein